MNISEEQLALDIVEMLFMNGYISSDHLLGAKTTALDVCKRQRRKDAKPLNDFLVRELPAMSEKEYFDGINQE